MRKHLYSFVVAMIIVIGLFISIHQSGKAEEAKNNNNLNIKLVHIDETMKEFYELHKSVKNEKIKEEKPKRPKLDVPNLSEEKLEYLWEKCHSENFSYELLLSIYMLESEQGTKKFHRNRNGTVDSGAFQINSGTVPNLAKEMGLKNYDIFNDFTSIDFAIQHLKDSRNFWTKKGMSDEDMFDYLILSYNLGDPNVGDYLQHNSIDDFGYLKVIKKYKSQFEMEENQ